MKVYLVDGRPRARAVDFDPEFTYRVSTEQFFAASIARRTGGFGFFLTDRIGYIRAMVDTLVREPGGSPESALVMLRRVRDGLRDPDVAPDLLRYQGFRGTNPLDAGRSAADAIDAYLAVP